MSLIAHVILLIENIKDFRFSRTRTVRNSEKIFIIFMYHQCVCLFTACGKQAKYQMSPLIMAALLSILKKIWMPPSKPLKPHSGFWKVVNSPNYFLQLR